MSLRQFPVWFFCLLLAGCRPSPAEIRVGSKKFTESVLLGEIATQLIRTSGVPATHRAQLGATQVLWHALLAGEIDVYPEYTGTVREDILKTSGQLQDDEALRQALAKFGVGMTRTLGFNNTYALGMKEDSANKLGIATISDLRLHPQLRFGITEEFFHRKDGWPVLRARYGLPELNLRTLDHDLAYRALADRNIDLTDLYSTDAEIPYYHLKVLEDDLHVFPQYQAVLLYREQLSSRSPDAIAALRELEGKVSEQTMQRLNARAKLERVPEIQVAADFLRTTLQVESSPRIHRWPYRVARYTLEHLLLVGISLTAAIAFAIPLGIAAGRRKRLGVFILGLAGVVQTIPSLALLVFMIPLLGIGTAPAVAALFLYSVLPVVRNTASGLAGIPVALLESADVLGLSPTARLWKIELPLASPSIFAGIQTSAVINVGTATLGALIGAGGLGQPIITGIRLDDLGLILEGAVPAAVLALVVQALFGGIGRVFIPKGLRLKRDT